MEKTQSKPNTAKVQRSERMDFVVKMKWINQSVTEEWFHSQACGSKECSARENRPLQTTECTERHWRKIGQMPALGKSTEWEGRIYGINLFIK
jgi:hypothetical protein